MGAVRAENASSPCSTSSSEKELQQKHVAATDNGDEYDDDKRHATTTGTTTTRAKEFVHIARSVDGSGQYVGITHDGIAHSWGRTNSLGQLGRTCGRIRRPWPVEFVVDSPDGSSPSFSPPVAAAEDGIDTTKVARGYAGGGIESGHTALLGRDGSLWLAGCDRWQQLGFGSSNAGAAGYTWKDGIRQSRFRQNHHIRDLMTRGSARTGIGGVGSEEERRGRGRKDGGAIRDLALGCDHTLVLDSNKKDVYAFGKGGEGQLGLVGRPFVSAPVRSTELSEGGSTKREIAAVCAIQHCSLTLGDNGDVLRAVGKCGTRNRRGFVDALRACVDRARNDDLLSSSSSSSPMKGNSGGQSPS